MHPKLYTKYVTNLYPYSALNVYTISTLLPRWTEARLSMIQIPMILRNPGVYDCFIYCHPTLAKGGYRNDLRLCVHASARPESCVSSYSYTHHPTFFNFARFLALVWQYICMWFLDFNSINFGRITAVFNLDILYKNFCSQLLRL